MVELGCNNPLQVLPLMIAVCTHAYCNVLMGTYLLDIHFDYLQVAW